MTDTTLVASAQAVTDTAADVGSAIVDGVSRAEHANIIVNLDRGASENVRIQLLGGNNYGDWTYVKATNVVPGATIATSNRQTYYEIDADEDQVIAFPYDLYKRWDRIKVQAWAGTVGATAATVTVYCKLG